MRISVCSRLARMMLLASVCCVPAVGCSGGTSTGGKASVKANFEKVNTGMSEKEVTDTLGTATASVEVDPKKLKEMLPKGVPMPDLPAIELPGVSLPKFTMKTWEEGDTVFTVMLQDGKVISKESAQKKDKERPAAKKVTKENAEKIKVGMKKAEVEAILGTGTAKAGAKIEDLPGAEVLVWESEEGIINVGFIDDKAGVVSKWQPKK